MILGMKQIIKKTILKFKRRFKGNPGEKRTSSWNWSQTNPMTTIWRWAKLNHLKLKCWIILTHQYFGEDIEPNRNMGLQKLTKFNNVSNKTKKMLNFHLN
jgi:hypothetical protein